MSASTSPCQNVLHHLQQTFAFLRHSMRSIYSPAEFVKASRPPWFEPGRQQDCSEFLRFASIFHLHPLFIPKCVCHKKLYYVHQNIQNRIVHTVCGKFSLYSGFLKSGCSKTGLVWNLDAQESRFWMLKMFPKLDGPTRPKSGCISMP